MARELMLLRHAKSDWPEGVADFNRPLKKRGRKAALRMGEWLLKQQLHPDWIVSSPAVRTQETADLLCKGLGLSKQHMLHLDDRIYEADIDALKQVLADCPASSQRVLLIGHNPSLDDLLLYLVDDLKPDSDGKLFATATLARIELPDNWDLIEPRSGRLKMRIRAKYLLLDG
jgi:phosphohistidine phosphatase